MIPKITMRTNDICGLILFAAVAFIFLYNVGTVLGMWWLMMVFVLSASVYLLKPFVEEVRWRISYKWRCRLYVIAKVCPWLCVVFIAISTIIGLINQ